MSDSEFKSIAINLDSGAIKAQSDYRSTSFKSSPSCDKKTSLSRLPAQNELLSFTSLEQGGFEAQGKGLGLNQGGEIVLTLKGATDLVLRFKVLQINYMIEPAHHWKAQLQCEQFDRLLINQWRIECDQCGEVSALEFVSRPEDCQALKVLHATDRMTALGWKKMTESTHICPSCLDRLLQ